LELMVQGLTPPGAVKADFLAAMGLDSSNQRKLTSSGSGVPTSRSGRRRDRGSKGLLCIFLLFSRLFCQFEDFMILSSSSQKKKHYGRTISGSRNIHM
jgi:hypothetical protein